MNRCIVWRRSQILMIPKMSYDQQETRKSHNIAGALCEGLFKIKWPYDTWWFTKYVRNWTLKSHCTLKNNRRVFSLNNTTKSDEGHVTNKNRIPCIGPTMQASGWDWGHVGESGQHNITLSDLWHTDGPWLTWVMSGGGIASRMGKLWTVTGHGGS